MYFRVGKYSDTAGEFVTNTLMVPFGERVFLKAAKRYVDLVCIHDVVSFPDKTLKNWLEDIGIDKISSVTASRLVVEYFKTVKANDRNEMIEAYYDLMAACIRNRNLTYAYITKLKCIRLCQLWTQTRFKHRHSWAVKLLWAVGIDFLLALLCAKIV